MYDNHGVYEWEIASRPVTERVSIARRPGVYKKAGGWRFAGACEGDILAGRLFRGDSDH